MMSIKDNFLNAINHKPVDFMPLGFIDSVNAGFISSMENGMGAGIDAFGVHWVAPQSGGGQPIPAPGEFLLKDISKWKSTVPIPNVDDYDWASMAEADLAAAMYDKEIHVLEYDCPNGVFERLGALMGFEAALVSMATNPDAVNDIFTAITDYKIKLAEKVALHYKPDMFTYYDDIATERNTFMSPKCYRKLIKPHHKRFYDAVWNLGMIPIQHTCGKAETLIEDFIETGAAGWSSVQPSNDIARLLDKYGDRYALIGGYDTNGKPGMESATYDVIEAEVKRCFDEYGDKPGYIFAGFRIANSLDPNSMMEAMQPIIDAAMKIRDI